MHCLTRRPAAVRPITSRPSTPSRAPVTIYRPVAATQPPRSTQAAADRVSSHGKQPSTGANSIPSGGKPAQAPHSGHLPHVAASQWQPTTEPGFVTRLKNKPSSPGKPNKPNKPTKKPWQSTTHRAGHKTTTTTK